MYLTEQETGGVGGLGGEEGRLERGQGGLMGAGLGGGGGGVGAPVQMGSRGLIWVRLRWIKHLDQLIHSLFTFIEIRMKLTQGGRGLRE